MKLFDLHCDTPYELYRKNKNLKSNDLHVSLDRASVFDKYIQCAAVWSDSKRTDEECYELFFSIADRFEKECGGFITSKDKLSLGGQHGFILSCEDARLLCNDISRLSLLYKKGVRILTLNWSQKSCIGSAWNTEGGLTDFGKEALEGCFDIGIVPDISHSNYEVTSYALKRSRERGLPVIATHSNSRAVCPHMRNLSDEHAKSIAKLGGIVGISLFPPHLRGEKADISDILDHIRHYVSILGSDSVCTGCDLDGIGTTPNGISHLGELPRLYDALSKAFSPSVAESVFFNNAYNFFINNLSQ